MTLCELEFAALVREVIWLWKFEFVICWGGWDFDSLSLLEGCRTLCESEFVPLLGTLLKKMMILYMKYLVYLLVLLIFIFRI